MNRKVINSNSNAIIVTKPDINPQNVDIVIGVINPMSGRTITNLCYRLYVAIKCV